MKKSFPYLIAFTILFFTGCNDNIYTASQKGEIEVLKKLIAKGSDINKKNKKGQLPIFLAIQNDHVDIVRYLVEHRADLTLQDQYAGTPLHNAAFMGNIEIAKLLINAGADVNAVSSRDGSTPICNAVMEDKVEMVRFLLERGADLNVKIGYYEETLLHFSVSNVSNDIEITKILLNAGMNVSVLDKQGKTPLHAVALSIWTGPSIEKMAKFLIEKGADLKLKDDQGMTALDYAKQKKKMGLIKVLENWEEK